MVELYGARMRLGTRQRRICFLYIAQAHQVLHSLSVAVALALAHPDVQVDIAATDAGVLDYARLLVGMLGAPKIGWRLLKPAWLRALRTADGSPPKVPMLAANARALADYDIIVTPERTSAALRAMGVKSKLVYTQHGAGDRAGPFEARLGAFDLVFSAGAKQRDRMVSAGLVRPEACAVVGYPKFDLVDRLRPVLPRLFAEVRPTVLYNPHFLTRLSSWPAWGRQVLEAFASQRRYNLIFAPHVRLFGGRPLSRIPELAPFLGHSGIHMDVGGTSASIDMTYTRLAGIYLGDVSSQVYEFLREPKPCVFLNPHNVVWQGDDSYSHWKFGQVVEHLNDLPAALARAGDGGTAYAAAQRDGFASTFDTSTRSSSDLAASAIAKLLNG